MRPLGSSSVVLIGVLSSCTGYFHQSAIEIPLKRDATLTGTLSVTSATPLITVANTATVTVSGGDAPYSFSITAGSGSISSSGVFTPAGVGNTSIEVIDAAGRKGEVSVSTVDTLGASIASYAGAIGASTSVSITGGVPPFAFTPTSLAWGAAGSSGTLSLEAWGYGSLDILDSLGNTFQISAETYLEDGSCGSLSTSDPSWAVKITLSGSSRCTGVMLSPDRVLTTASCVDGVVPSALNVETLANSSPQVSTVSSSVSHLGYNVSQVSDNLALLRLSSPLIPGVGFCLTPPPRPSDNKLLTINALVQVGSAKSWIDDNFTYTAGATDFRLTDSSTSLAALGISDPSPSKLIGVTQDSNACPIDSGSPVILGGQAVGIVAYSHPVTPCDFSSMALRIDAYYDWLSANWN